MFVHVCILLKFVSIEEFFMIFYLSFCMYKLNLNRDLKIEEMKKNICFLQAYFNEKYR